MSATSTISVSKADVASTSSGQFSEALSVLFGDLAELFGNPRSYGLIYGTLFASPHPLSMEEVSERLDLSIGSASMGLRRLEEFGAVARERGNGRNNSALFSARYEMRLLVGGFLRERVLPRIEATREQLGRIEHLLESLPADQHPMARQRMERLSRWHQRAQTVLPFIQKLLSGG